jgi:hypothetical protein
VKRPGRMRRQHPEENTRAGMKERGPDRRAIRRAGAK